MLWACDEGRVPVCRARLKAAVELTAGRLMAKLVPCGDNVTSLFCRLLIVLMWPKSVLFPPGLEGGREIWPVGSRGSTERPCYDEPVEPRQYEL
jgi:hypothetical protein